MEAARSARTETPSSPLNQPGSISLSDSSAGSSRGRKHGISDATKRSRTHSGSRRDLRRLKRQKYRDEYRVLLNECISDATDPYAHESELDEQNFPPSQIGLTHWTSQEKSNLFTALSKRGRHDAPSLALATNTKSELEVQQYLDLLKKGLREQHEDYRRETILRYADIPAALEISPQSCKKLEDVGDALSVIFGEREMTAEKTKWGRYWKLTHGLVQEIDDHINPDDDATDHQRGSEYTKRNDVITEPGWEELAPVVEMFNTPIWLELSERIFMNSSSKSESVDSADHGSPSSWPDFTPTETPSILATALTDFYNLTVALTKRLAYSAHFQAISRLRATDVRSRPRKRKLAISKHDIWTTANTLGLKSHSRRFWQTAPRRHGLSVYDTADDFSLPIDGHRKLGDSMTYDEVERRLDPLSKRRRSARKRKSNTRPAIRQASDFSDADMEWRDVPDSTAEDDLAAQHESEADRLDVLSSTVEEARLLRDVLGELVPAEMCPGPEMADVKARGNRPPIERKTQQDLKDWRDSIDYQAPWEGLGQVFDFEQARTRLERRATKRRGLGQERLGLEDTHQVDMNTTDRDSDDASDNQEESNAHPESSNDDTDLDSGVTSTTSDASDVTETSMSSDNGSTRTEALYHEGARLPERLDLAA